MMHVLDGRPRVGRRGVRLVQAAFHNRSLSLYTKLGFDPREPLSCVQGAPIAARVPGYDVRPATPTMSTRVTPSVCGCMATTRDGELRDAVAHGAATVVEHGGRITGYATTVAFFGHAVAETNDGSRGTDRRTPRSSAGPASWSRRAMPSCCAGA